MRILRFDKPTEMTYEAWQDYFGIGYDVEMDATHETKMLEDYGLTNIDYRLPRNDKPILEYEQI